jgi:hypothetical protein
MPLLQATAIEDYFNSSPTSFRQKRPKLDSEALSTTMDSTSPVEAPPEMETGEEVSSTSSLRNNTQHANNNNNASNNSDDPRTTSPQNKWQAKVDYQDVMIEELEAGLKGVRLMVRVVNVFDVGGGSGGAGGSGKVSKAGGCLRILGSDGTGVLEVCIG